MKNLKVRVLNYICAAVALVLLVLQFMPFWSNISIQAFTWFPDHFTDLRAYFDSLGEGFFSLNVFGIFNSFVFLFGILGVFFCVFKAKNSLMPIVTAACGVIASAAYQSVGVLQLAPSLNSLHLTFSEILLVASVLALLFTNYSTKSPLSSIILALVGMFGVIVYLYTPAYAAGNTWLYVMNLALFELLFLAFSYNCASLAWGQTKRSLAVSGAAYGAVASLLSFAMPAVLRAFGAALVSTDSLVLVCYELIWNINLVISLIVLVASVATMRVMKKTN